MVDLPNKRLVFVDDTPKMLSSLSNNEIQDHLFSNPNDHHKECSPKIFLLYQMVSFNWSMLDHLWA